MRKRALVVEDEGIAENLKSYMEGFGYKSRIMKNGAEALDYLKGADKSEKPDVILLDRTMPEMDGYEFLRNVESDPEIIGGAQIILTGSFERQKLSGLNLNYRIVDKGILLVTYTKRADFKRLLE